MTVFPSEAQLINGRGVVLCCPKGGLQITLDNWGFNLTLVALIILLCCSNLLAPLRAQIYFIGTVREVLGPTDTKLILDEKTLNHSGLLT